jgi:hypothetical protein
MSFSLYDISIPTIKNCLLSLTRIVDAAASTPNLASARLVDDMLPLSFQIHFATDLAVKAAHRLQGREPPQLSQDDCLDFDGFRARISAAIETLDAVDKDLVNSRADQEVTLGLGPGKSVQISPAGYVQAYAVPNSFFHVTTAYNIVRKEGVAVGKMTYIKPFGVEHIPMFKEIP